MKKKYIRATTKITFIYSSFFLLARRSCEIGKHKGKIFRALEGGVRTSVGTLMHLLAFLAGSANILHDAVTILLTCDIGGLSDFLGKDGNEQGEREWERERHAMPSQATPLSELTNVIQLLFQF